jgi:hypothetical protein
MNCQACRQDNAILNFNRPMGKSSYEQLIPTCKLLQQVSTKWNSGGKNLSQPFF